MSSGIRLDLTGLLHSPSALVCAGLLSVLIFPLIALGLLRRDEPDSAPVPDVTAPIAEPHLM